MRLAMSVLLRRSTREIPKKVAGEKENESWERTDGEMQQHSHLHTFQLFVSTNLFPRSSLLSLNYQPINTLYIKTPFNAQ